MSGQTNSFSDQEKCILALLDGHLSDMHDNFDKLERKARFNFTLTSTMAAVVFLFNLDLFNAGSLSNEMLRVLALFSLSYMAVAVLSILTLWPREIELRPMEPTWKTVEEFRNYGWDEFRDQLIEHHVSIRRFNEPIMS